MRLFTKLLVIFAACLLIGSSAACKHDDESDGKNSKDKNSYDAGSLDEQERALEKKKENEKLDDSLESREKYREIKEQLEQDEGFQEIKRRMKKEMDKLRNEKYGEQEKDN